MCGIIGLLLANEEANVSKGIPLVLGYFLAHVYGDFVVILSSGDYHCVVSRQ